MESMEMENTEGAEVSEETGTIRKQVDLVPLSRQLSISGVKIGICGALLPREPTVEVINRVITMSGTLDKAGQWILGDALCALDNKGIDPYSQEIQDLTHRAQQTLVNLAYLCRNVPHDLRRPELTVFHHQIVAPLSSEEQAYWLTRATDEKWTGAELRRQVRIARTENPVSDRDVELLPEAQEVSRPATKGSKSPGDTEAIPDTLKNFVSDREGAVSHVEIPLEGRYRLPWVHIANFSITNDTGTYEFNFEVVRQAMEAGKERYVGFANNRHFCDSVEVNTVYRTIEEFCYNLIHRSSDVIEQARELIGPLPDRGAEVIEMERIPEGGEPRESVLTEDMLAGI